MKCSYHKVLHSAISCYCPGGIQMAFYVWLQYLLCSLKNLFVSVENVNFRVPSIYVYELFLNTT